MALTGPNVNISSTAQTVGASDGGVIVAETMTFDAGSNIILTGVDQIDAPHFINSSEAVKTRVRVSPNGAMTDAGVVCYNNSDRSNNSYLASWADATSINVQSSANGTGTQLPLKLKIGATAALTIDASRNVSIGAAAIATNATNGFLYIPTCAGVPTGTPTAITGAAPLVIDSTNNKMYFYSGGAWNALN